jgi:hypothetical protein
MKTKLILLSTILLISCSSRKSTTQTDKVDLKVETETKVKETDNTKTKTDVVIDKETNEVTEIETIEPIDNTKPSFYNGKTFTNSKITKRKTNVLSKEKNKANQVVENDKKVVKKERVNAKVDVKTKSKQTERKTSILDYWWLLLLLVLVYIGYKKRK